MKKAIVYYSMSGNTEYVAKYISEKKISSNENNLGKDC